jgi:hypothetical protein
VEKRKGARFELFDCLYPLLLLSEMDEPDGFVLRISFGKDTLTLPVSPTTSIEILRAQLFDLTKVAPDRQKLNAAGGKKIADEMTMQALGWTAKTKIQLIGTPEENVFVFDAISQQNNVEEDEEEEVLELHMRPENVLKLQKRIDTVEVEEISPAVHKNLLVVSKNVCNFFFFDGMKAGH